MTTDSYNPRDAEFLLSRDLDGELSPDERRALQARVQQSPALGNESTGFGAVADLLRQWGTTAPDVDWDAHLALTMARLDDDAEAGDQALNSLLSRWAANAPAHDDSRFTQLILSQIRGKLRQPAYRRILRWSAPLAAAAALAFVVTAVYWHDPPVKTLAIVQIGPVSPDSEYEPLTDSRAVVSFARAAAPAERNESGIGLLSLGDSVASRSSDAAPL